MSGRLLGLTLGSDGKLISTLARKARDPRFSTGNYFSLETLKEELYDVTIKLSLALPL